MVRKKVEGDEDQRRAAARDAERSGDAPSARSVTTGASKQRTHVPDRRSLTHEEKTAPLHRGKQRVEDEARRTEEWRPPEESLPNFHGRGQQPYDERHERVFGALAELEREHGGEAVYLDDIAQATGIPREDTRALLHDLMTVQRLVTQLPGADDSPDQGPRYETKPRL